MHGVDLLVAFCCLLSVIERSKEILALRKGVVGPLSLGWNEECVAKESLIFVLLGQQRHFLQGGRAAYTGSGQNTWEYDATRGFPGEDICTPSQGLCVY